MPLAYTKAETLLRQPKGSVSEAIIAARVASRPFESGSAYRPSTNESRQLPIHPQAAFKDPYSNEIQEMKPMKSRVQVPDWLSMCEWLSGRAGVFSMLFPHTSLCDAAVLPGGAPAAPPPCC